MLFPRRSSKPKQGDSTKEELAAAAQHKGVLQPIVHDKRTLEKVTLTDELKVMTPFQTPHPHPEDRQTLKTSLIARGRFLRSRLEWRLIACTRKVHAHAPAKCPNP